MAASAGLPPGSSSRSLRRRCGSSPPSIATPLWPVARQLTRQPLKDRLTLAEHARDRRVLVASRAHSSPRRRAPRERRDRRRLRGGGAAHPRRARRAGAGRARHARGIRQRTPARAHPARRRADRRAAGGAARLQHRPDQRPPRRSDDQARLPRARRRRGERARRGHDRRHRRPRRRQRAGAFAAHRAASRLTARHGAFFVTGNHEYYSGARRVDRRRCAASGSRCS